MEQNIKPRNNPIYIWSIELQQRRREYTKGKGPSLQEMVLGKLGSYMQKNETEPFSDTIYKHKLKMDKRPKCEV